MVSYDCLRVPHALSALSSLQGNRCQQSCEAGFYHDKQEGTCKPCHKACATCAGKSAGQGPGARTVNSNLFKPVSWTEPFELPQLLFCTVVHF